MEQLTYIITYELKSLTRNYTDFYDALQRYDGWAKLTDTSYAIISTSNCIQVRDYLLRFIDANDRLLVISSGTSAAWHNPIAQNEWLKQKIRNIQE